MHCGRCPNGESYLRYYFRNPINALTNHSAILNVPLTAVAIEVQLMHDDKMTYSLRIFGLYSLQSLNFSGCCNHDHSCILLIFPPLPACHRVSRFVASSLFLYRGIFSKTYRIFYRVDST